MKHFLILLTIIFITASSKAQYVTIPDAGLRQQFMMFYPNSFNASQQLDTTSAEVINATNFSYSGSVSSWYGIRFLKNLQMLNMSGIDSLPSDLPATLKMIQVSLSYNLTTVPMLPEGLTSLSITDTQITVFPDVLPSTLIYFGCSYNSALQTITSIPASVRVLSCDMDYALTGFSSLSSVDSLYARQCNFTSLPALPADMKFLSCPNGALTSLPALPATLRYLDCGSNQLTSLPALPAQIDYVNVSNNQITNLPALTAPIKTMMAGSNLLTSIPALPASLITLEVPNNQITSLPTLTPSLETLNVGNNQISLLPLLPASLKNLDCSRNLLAALPAIPSSLLQLVYAQNAISVFPLLPNTLRYLNCSSNQITTIPSLPDSLRHLYCGENLLSSLPAFPHYLAYIICPSNQLTSLPALPDTLISLNCAMNNLTCLPVLPPGLNNGNISDELSLYIDDVFTCFPNYPVNFYMLNVRHSDGTSNLYFAGDNPFPLCTATNNVYHCAAFPIMTGRVYYDNNNNATHDVGEPYRANVKVQLSNGAWTYTNTNGYYQLSADGTGNYSTEAANLPPYFAAVPAQYHFNFISNDTLVVSDFALQGTTTRDSLGISINPVNAAARPGFPYPYQIVYSNDGTTTLNSNVVFNYDNTRLIFDSCSNASVINTGSSLTLSESGFAPGMQKNFIGYLRISPTAVIGDSLRVGAHIVSGSVAANDSDVVEIRGSFDPNDKAATPTLSPAQVINGDYIYYTIRFQNTGTDTAFNIVVTDTLNSQLQVSTLQMINTSHPCITTVKGNAISFEFINILLPDSNVNELKSHGYISFRIKPLNTLVLNDIVPNKAAIYFDFNSPVITNIATTTVVEPIVVPLKLLSFSVSSGIGQHANLYWQTSNEVSVKHYEIEMSSNGRTFAVVGSENAKGYQYNSYTKTIDIPADAVLYFRLKMTDIDGRYAYSNVAILKNDQANSTFSFSNNPVKDELIISLQDESLKNTTATIFNAQGIKVRTVLLQHDVERVNIKSLTAGTYYLVTEKGSGQFVVVR